MNTLIKNSELSAIKDALLLLEAGQRHGAVAATGADGKPLYFQKTNAEGGSENVPVILHTYPGDHKKFVFTDEGAVRFKIARALKKVEAAMRDLEKGRNDLLEMALDIQHKEDRYKGNPDLAAEYVSSYRKELHKLVNSTIELDVNQIPLSWLTIDKNSIQSSVLSALLDIVIFDDSGTLYEEKPKKA